VSWTARRRRALFTLGSGSLLLLALLGAACAGLAPPETGEASSSASSRRVPDGRQWEEQIREHCRQARLEGVFNRQTLSQDPELAAAVERKLCRSGLAVVGLEAGFGAGTRVFGLFLREGDYALSWELYGEPSVVPPAAAALLAGHRSAMEQWKAEHCGASDDTSPDLPKGPLGLYAATERTRAHWATERALVEPRLRHRWESCMADLAPPAGPKAGALRCRAVETSDPASLFFTLQHHRRADLAESFLPFPHRATRLTADLRVSGADCDLSGWRRAMKLPRGRATLRCRRSGPGPVRFTAETQRGVCTADLQ
jgi:hypothetical protein